MPTLTCISKPPAALPREPHQDHTGVSAPVYSGHLSLPAQWERNVRTHTFSLFMSNLLKLLLQDPQGSLR